MYHGISKGEQQTAERLVARCLAAGFTVSVWDGGDEPAISKSADKAAIMDAIGNTDQDKLVLWDAMRAARIGSILLIWGNAPDGSELAADYSDNDKVRHIVEL